METTTQTAANAGKEMTTIDYQRSGIVPPMMWRGVPATDHRCSERCTHYSAPRLFLRVVK